jgi:hypothetical protein
MGAVSLEVVPVNSSTASLPLSLGQLHARFLAIVPRIELHAHISFRDVTCAAQKADWSAETVALCWKWFVRLAEQGKDATEFVSALAGYATRAVRSGRRLCGQLRANDVFSEVAQRQYGFTVQPLPSSTTPSWEVRHSRSHSPGHFNAYEERLRDSTVTPPPEAAAFRIDFPQFLQSLTDRDRRLAEYLSLGHQAAKAAGQFGLSPGRVTQLRQRWCQEWRAFQGEERAHERTHRTEPRVAGAGAT